MAEMREEFRDDSDDVDDEDDEEDEEVNDLISHFELLTHDQMKQALDIAKVTLKKRRRKRRLLRSSR
jgi:hypothetical protein